MQVITLHCAYPSPRQLEAPPLPPQHSMRDLRELPVAPACSPRLPQASVCRSGRPEGVSRKLAPLRQPPASPRPQIKAAGDAAAGSLRAAHSPSCLPPPLPLPATACPQPPAANLHCPAAHQQTWTTATGRTWCITSRRRLPCAVCTQSTRYCRRRILGALDAVPFDAHRLRLLHTLSIA